MRKELRAKFDTLLNELEAQIVEDVKTELGKPKKKPGPAKGTPRAPRKTEGVTTEASTTSAPAKETTTSTTEAASVAPATTKTVSASSETSTAANEPPAAA